MFSPSPARLLPVVLLASEPIAPNYMRQSMLCSDLARTIIPGQFFDLAVPGDARELLRIPLTQTNVDPSHGIVEFVYRVVGNGTRRLASLPEGTRTDLLGPCGNGWKIDENAKHVLLVGGGAGIAPLVALAHVLGPRGIAFDVLEGASTARGVIFERSFYDMGAARFDVATEDGTRGTHGTPVEALPALIEHNTYDAAYICGPNPMMAGLAKQFDQTQTPCQVSMEANMGCGFGGCATCAIDTINGKKGVCKDGPIFDAKEVIW